MFEANLRKYKKKSKSTISNNLNDDYIIANPFLFKSKIRNSKEVKPEKISLILTLINFSFIFVSNICKRLKPKDKYSNFSNYKKINKISTIFVSHLSLNNNFSGSFNDNYFGKIFDINEGKTKKLIIYIPHNIKKISNNLKKNLDKNKNLIIIIPRKENPDKEILKIIISFLKSIKLILKSIFKNNLYDKWFYRKLAISISNETTLQNIADIENIIEIIKKTDCKKIFFPFEGFAWERLLLKKINELNYSINTYGYINSGVFKYQISIYEKIKKNIYPNYFLTCGSLINNYLCHRLDIDDKRIFNIGSNRSKKITKKNYKIRNSNNILILLEALNDEINILINFGKVLAKLNKNLKIIIKVHPLTNPDFIKNKINNYSNIDISVNQNIYKYSNFVIFRGSTSILEAIQYGCIPIYFNNNSDLNVSPISMFVSKFFNINNNEDFKRHLSNHEKINYRNELLNIYSKMRYYYEPLKINLITKIMND